MANLHKIALCLRVKNILNEQNSEDTQSKIMGSWVFVWCVKFHNHSRWKEHCKLLCVELSMVDSGLRSSVTLEYSSSASAIDVKRMCFPDIFFKMLLTETWKIMVNVFGLKLRNVNIEEMLHFSQILMLINSFKFSPYSYDAFTISF